MVFFSKHLKENLKRVLLLLETEKRSNSQREEKSLICQENHPTMKNHDLRQFLAQKEKEGRFLDTKAFTVDTFKARQKMDQFQLSSLTDTGLWLVKFVQTAVACGAPEVRISLGRRDVRVSFHNTKCWLADKLLEMTLEIDLPKEPALFHLATGLRASLSKVDNAVFWSCGGVKVRLTDKQVSIEKTEISPNFEIIVRRPPRSLSLSGLVKTPLRHLVKQTLVDYDAVYSRCWVSPIPIYFDGRKLKRGYSLRNGDKLDPENFKNSTRNQIGSNTCLSVEPIQSQERVSPILPYPISPIDPKSQSDLPSQQSKAQAILTLHTNFAKENMIYTILDGAVIDVKKLEDFKETTPEMISYFEPRSFVFHNRLHLAISLQDLDLSQFQCREPRFPKTFWEEIGDHHIQLIDKFITQSQSRLYSQELSHIKTSLLPNSVAKRRPWGRRLHG